MSGSAGTQIVQCAVVKDASIVEKNWRIIVVLKAEFWVV